MTMAQNLSLTLLANKLAVCQFEVSQGIPEWARVNQPFGSVTYTPDEISVVLPQEAVPKRFRKCEKGWRILKIDGILEFTLCGIVFSVLKILKKVSVSVFVISTFNTDFIMVKEKDLNLAVRALRKSIAVNEE
jgi:hypothetical protein